MATGLVSAIQRFSTEDGPGIRTTVFFKGCPLHCAWCHNPEGLKSEPELVFHDARCIDDQACIRACTRHGLVKVGQGIKVDREVCDACGECVDACPSGALELIGRSYGVHELFTILKSDESFYETSQGGITLSGGEPMQQAEFLGELLPRCQEAKLHVALDTCGASSWPSYEALLPLVDLVLYDLKIAHPRRHQEATGVTNQTILENARRIAKAKKPIWVRTPVIPGYTDDLENILALARFISDDLPTVERWDLLAYTNLGRPKYTRLDKPYPLADAPLLERATMEHLHREAKKIVPTVHWSGDVR